ncbi:restriction endonuclease subunit S [Aeromonas simiae]|uniref:restriction endonuclease subunit S n=1 Tax=Aeromonas simiae TaxID=218936 RepID=UPI00266D244A|nr:restriction endonuclease subunit S [Aeromonas simiae]MDO2949607.1 restriction endonuclease subunit S [Aeromonas simiae]MDO2953314.1 restriction endonuclease subunit S [Aeromonas simiae]MDO2956938.1 restriction endonuclease subunit S [Aeromonas simiae]
MAIENLITDHLDLWTAAVRPKSGAGRGASSKLELTGIKKLHELILGLAVRGKLVPQDPCDEPASVLLERIAVEKARLVKEGKIKKPKALPEIGEEEKPFELPAGWEFTRVGSIINRISNGFSGVQNKEGNGFPLTRIESISESVINMGRVGYSPSIPHDKLNYYRLNQGDILLSHINSDLHVGKTAIFHGNHELYHGVNLLLIRTSCLVSYDYIDLVFNQLRLSGYFLSVAQHAIGQSSINQSIVQSVLIPLPPLDEQHRIVAKVKELMALCDQLEQQSEAQLAAHQMLVETLLATLTDSADADELAQNWARLSAHFDTLFTTEASIDALKQTILQLAVMGKLVPQDPNDEPAAALLERIAAEKARLVKEKKIKKEKPLSVISEDEKPFELPQGWEWERFGRVFLDLKYGTSQKSDYLIDGNPVLRIPNVAGGSISLDDLKFSKLSEIEMNDLTLEEGDLLFIRSNGSLGIVGRGVVVDICLDGFAFAGYLVRARIPKNNFCSHFISLSMDTSYVRNQIEQPIRSTSGVKNINSTEISNLIIPVPPLFEQRRIVTKVNELMVICDQLKSRLQTSQQTQLVLAESLVEGALA